MDNKRMLDTAIETLSTLDAESIDTVQLERTKYDDGSVGYSVNVVFPASVQKEKSLGLSVKVDVDVDEVAKRLEERLKRVDAVLEGN